MPGSLRDISLFVAVYEARSFTAAAARENATQSGVSQHVRKLEESLDVRLFTRDKGVVAPTPAGDTYYQHCIDVLRAHEAARRSVTGYAKGFEGEIVVGLMPTMTRCVLAPANWISRSCQRLPARRACAAVCSCGRRKCSLPRHRRRGCILQASNSGRPDR